MKRAWTPGETGSCFAISDDGVQVHGLRETPNGLVPAYAQATAFRVRLPDGTWVKRGREAMYWPSVNAAKRAIDKVWPRGELP